VTTPDDFRFLDATAQADLVRRGEVPAIELVDAAIARIEAANGDLNAVIMTTYDAARQAAAHVDPDAPFAGVPFLLKDIGATQAGLPYHMGNVALKEAGHREPADTVLGARFRAAGLITLGKTNLPELGSVPTTQPVAYGPTANPWDLTRSPSGSSGGSAAAVAAGLVPIAHANDGGGSTRLPASWCGLVGLKASRGRMPAPASISRLSTELVVSRTVRDTAAALDATHGATDADLYQLPPPARRYVEELTASPPTLRVGLLTDGGEYEVDPECVAAADDAAGLLESMGHEVEPVKGDVLFGASGKVNGRLWMAGIARRVDAVGEMIGRPLTAGEVEPYNWTAAERGAAVTASEWTAAQEAQQRWVMEVLDWFEPYDLLVTPTSGCPPMRTDDLWPSDDTPWKMGRTYGRIGRFTLPFNATGQPAISLPLHWTQDGLPVGVQLVAAMGREDLLIQVAARLEEASPWADRQPS
jgi:amidase